MHMALTGGKHPIADESDDYNSFMEKLRNLKKCDPTTKFSDIALNLFNRLSAVHPQNRYAAKDALLHPWITRRRYTDIPLSFLDKVSNLEYERKLNK